MESKEAIRQRVKAIRETLAPDIAHQRSAKIQSSVSGLDSFVQARSVALYSAVRGEVETLELFSLAESAGKKMLFGCLDRGRLTFVRATSETPFRPGALGILEPFSREAWEVKEIDCVVVPGVAFDPRGFRLGFGGGHYDRALEGYGGITIGLAYDFQIVHDLPVRSGDLQCRWVVTESRILGRSL